MPILILHTGEEVTRGRVPNVWALEEDLHLPFKDAAWRSIRFFYSKQGGGVNQNGGEIHLVTGRG